MISPDAFLRRAACTVLILFLFAPPLAAVDVLRQVLLAWPEPDPRAVALAAEIGTGALFAPPAGRQSGEFLAACRRHGIEAVAEIRGAASAGELDVQAQAALAAGFTALAYDAVDDQAALRQFIASRPAVTQFVFLKPDQAAWDVKPAWAVVVEGLWPGIKPVDAETASATAMPWVDSNLWLYAWLRARFPARPALLGYRPNEAAGVGKDRRVGHHTVEIALSEAMAAGGNLVLAPPEDYRQALLAGEAEARKSWQALARTSAFLRRHADRFRSPAGARILVLAGSEEQSGEVLNLLFRMNATPAVTAVETPPPLDPGQTPVVVAANVTPPAPVQDRLWRFAEAGGTLIVAPDPSGEEPWWAARRPGAGRKENEHTVYSVGQGRLIAYHDTIVDAYESALDVLTVLGWKTRDLRLWNADTVVGLLRRNSAGASAVLIDYGTRWQREHEPDFLIQLFGAYPQVTLLAPELDQPLVLAPRVRGPLTEFEMRDLRQFAILELKAGTQ